MKKSDIPNFLTFLRIVLILISMVLAANALQDAGETLKDHHIYLRYTAFVLAVIAAVTDLFDGYLARKWNQISDLGALMDPIADKIFVTASMLILVEFKLMPCWIMTLIISREFMVSGLRMAALRHGVLISADRWGKRKTALQMFMLALGGLIWVKNWDIRQMYLTEGLSLYRIWWVLLLCIVAITLFSGLGYFRQYRRIVRGEKSAEEPAKDGIES